MTLQDINYIEFKLRQEGLDIDTMNRNEYDRSVFKKYRQLTNPLAATETEDED